MFNVEGRQMKERIGVRRVAEADRGKLQFGEFGLQPSNKHRGVTTEEKMGLKHFDVKYSETAVQRGKKHIDMVHQQPLEVRKRLAGKIGVKKVKPVMHTEPAQRTRPSVNSQTCEQRAKARLERAVHEDPSVAPIVEKAMSANSAEALIEAERRLLRQQALAKAAKWRSEKTAADASPKRDPPSALSKLETPYATSNAAVSPPLHFYRKAVTQPQPQEPRHRGVAISAARSRQDPIPFDTKFSCAEYPEPPPIGVPASVTHRRGKQLAEPHFKAGDFDEVAQRRAEARRQATDGGMPDFIFGNVPPPEPKRLRGGGGPSGASASDGQYRHRHRAVDPSKYKSTSLW